MARTAYKPTQDLIKAQEALQKRQAVDRAGCRLPWQTPAPLPAVKAVAQLPPHLGWESVALSTYLRRKQTRTQTRTEPWARPIAPTVIEWQESTESPHSDELTGTVKIYPEIAIASLGRNDRRTNSVLKRYLTYRHQDIAGSGNVSIDMPANKAQRKKLQRDLQAGAGSFWTWDKAHNRLFLHSWDKVAHALGVARLKLHPVYLPIEAIDTSLQRFKANLFAVWLTSNHNRVMSQDTIEELYHINRRTQQRYIKIAGILSRPQYAIGEPYNQETAQETAYQRGNSTFVFTDRRGHQGRPGQQYMAWRLPNQYQTKLDFAPRGMQRRHNRQLIDLFTERATGNDGDKVVRVFHDNVVKAVRFVRHCRESVDAYYPARKQARYCTLWEVIPKKKH